METSSRGAVLALSPEQRAALARNALLLCSASSHRTLEFAAKRMRELFAAEIDPEDFRAAQLEMLREATTAISGLLHPAGRKA